MSVDLSISLLPFFFKMFAAKVISFFKKEQEKYEIFNYTGAFFQDKNQKREAQKLITSMAWTVTGNKVTGTMSVQDANRFFRYNLSGRFLINRNFISLRYSFENKSKVCLGHIFIVVGADTNHLTGHLHGFGCISEGVISGTIHLDREP